MEQLIKSAPLPISDLVDKYFGIGMSPSNGLHLKAVKDGDTASSRKMEDELIEAAIHKWDSTGSMHVKTLDRALYIIYGGKAHRLGSLGTCGDCVKNAVNKLREEQKRRALKANLEAQANEPKEEAKPTVEAKQTESKEFGGTAKQPETPTVTIAATVIVDPPKVDAKPEPKAEAKPATQAASAMLAKLKVGCTLDNGEQQATVTRIASGIVYFKFGDNEKGQVSQSEIGTTWMVA